MRARAFKIVRAHTGPGDVTLARTIETPAYGSTTYYETLSLCARGMGDVGSGQVFQWISCYETTMFRWQHSRVRAWVSQSP